MTTNSELIERLRVLEQDHKPDGWPAIQMRDVTALLDTIEAQSKQIESMNSAEKTLSQMGYTTEGGEYWKPPLGKAPDFDLLNSLHMQIEALQADAERYRWLRDPEAIITYVTHGRGDFCKNLMSGSMLDEAIDAALAAQKGGA